MSVPEPGVPVSRLSDADMRAVPAALARAAHRARELAVRSGTPLVINEDGRVIEKAVVAFEDPRGANGAR